MTKVVMGLIMMSLALGCGKGFNKEKSDDQPEVTPRTGAISISAMSIDYLDLLNEHRSRLGLRNLISDPQMEEIARTHSMAMARGLRGLGHYDLSLRCRKISSRLGPHKLCAEVVAKGPKTAQEALKIWLASPEHKYSLENPHHSHTGLAAYEDSKGEMYWTQIFVSM